MFHKANDVEVHGSVVLMECLPIVREEERVVHIGVVRPAVVLRTASEHLECSAIGRVRSVPGHAVESITRRPSLVAVTSCSSTLTVMRLKWSVEASAR